MKKAIISGLVLTAVFPILANAGIFTYHRLKTESNCVSADGKYSGKFKVSTTGTKNTIFTSGEFGNEITEFKLKNKMTGAKYSCSKNLDMGDADCGEDSLEIKRSGTYVFVGISLNNQQTEVTVLNCPELTGEPPVNPSVPDLVLHLESKAFTDIQWAPKVISDDLFAEYMDGKIFDLKWDGSLPSTIGTCRVGVSQWNPGAGARKLDKIPVKLIQTYSYPASYQFVGTTETYTYAISCSLSKPYENYYTKKANSGPYLDVKLTPQQVKNLILKALPAGLVSFSK